MARTESGVQRECPHCGADSVVSRSEAGEVFHSRTATREVLAANPGVRYICTSCLAGRVRTVAS